MSDVLAIAVTSRTATLLLSPQTACYHLPRPVAWSLHCAGKGVVAEGTSGRVALFLDDLAPDTAFELVSDLGRCGFRTLPCAGLVDVTDFGADPAAADNASAFARAVAAVPVGGTLSVPAGVFYTRPVFLRPRMTLHLRKGAVIAAPGARDGWPKLAARDGTGRVVGTWEGLPEDCFAAPVSAIDCDGLHITGPGTIDGGGDRGDWWSWPKETRDGARRPRTLFLAHSRGVIVSGITVRNSPSWTVHPFFCHDLTIAAVQIQNPADSPNTDGLDPESCTGVRLAGLRISVGDDCIAVKAGKRGPGAVDHLAPTRNLSIHNCLMEFGHGAVVLGSEMSGDITDVTITRCRFEGTDRGLRIKTRRGRGGKVARVRLDGVEMNGVGTPLAANAFYFCDPDGRSDAVQSRDPAPVDDTTPAVFDISLTDVTAHRVQIAAVALLGLPEAPITGFRIENFRVSYDPEAVADVPLMACHLPRVRHAGIWSQFAEIEGALSDLPLHEDVDPC